MGRWVITGLVVAVPVGLALVAGWWVAPLLAFTGANSEQIQGLESLVQLFLWGCAAVGIVTRLSLRGWPHLTPERGSSDDRHRVTASGNRSIAVGGDAAGAHISTGDTGARRSRDVGGG